MNTTLQGNKVDTLSTQNFDMKGRRAVRAGDAVELQDYVTLNDLQKELQITIALINRVFTDVGTPGTYTSVTTDVKGRVIAGTTSSDSITVQSVVTGSRTLGTVYQNTGTGPMFVAVTISSVSGGGANFGEAHAITDSAAAPTTVVGGTFNGSAVSQVYQVLGFWVLPGNYYKVVQITTTVALITWIEWT